MRGYYPGEREHRERPPKPKGPTESRKKKAPRRGRRIDWVIGIVLGIVLGIGVVVGFLVLGSEDTIDAPSISKPAGAQPAKEAELATAPSGER